MLGVDERTVDRRRGYRNPSRRLWARREGRRVYIWIPEEDELSLEVRLRRAEARVDEIERQLCCAESMNLELHRIVHGNVEDAEVVQSFRERVGRRS